VFPRLIGFFHSAKVYCGGVDKEIRMKRRHLFHIALAVLLVGMVFTGAAAADEGEDEPPLISDIGDKAETVIIDYLLKAGGPLLFALGAVGMFFFKSTNMVSRCRSLVWAGLIATGIATAWELVQAALTWFWSF